MTGAVSTVDAEVFEERPVMNAVQALQGAIPGLNIVGGTGELNRRADINIRGVGTIGDGSSGSPLILIDGMEGDLNLLNPQDIERCCCIFYLWFSCTFWCYFGNNQEW